MGLDVKIKKTYKDFILDLDFKSEGERVGILGASGCGKSLTLKCLAGIIKPDQGHITLNDRVLLDTNKKVNIKPQVREVGYLFQNYALFPNMTVAQNIAVGFKGSKEDKKRIIQDMVNSFRLDGLENHYPSQLSGGQQQRTALARLLASKPQVILLDEPFSALDTYLKEELHIELNNILKSYRGEVILVTHSRDEVYKLCDKLIIMKDGKILEYGPTKELFKSPKTLEGAKLTGCKNISSARKVSTNKLIALDWGINLTAKGPLPDEDFYIGIRAHDFKPFIKDSGDINKIPCKVNKIIQSLFEWSLLIETKECQSSDKFIWWKIGESHISSQGLKEVPEYLTVDPEDIIVITR
ncbi:MAG: ATP-binding cassette domain-containing protein [Clostridiales bacterium]|nr:ATP-binding cassette domain-containing protein [Clostridiales bacterium]